MIRLKREECDGQVRYVSPNGTIKVDMVDGTAQPVELWGRSGWVQAAAEFHQYELSAEKKEREFLERNG